MQYKNSFLGKDFFKNIPKLVDYPTRKDWEDSCWDTICLLSGQTPQSVLPLLVSTAERKKLVYRAAVIGRILEGARTSEIGRELWATKQTISALRKALKDNVYISSRGRGYKKKEYSPLASSRKEYRPMRRTK